MVLLHTQQIIRYFRVAPAAVWIFDYWLTFEHEVRLFSSMGRWSITHVMFIITRYIPIAWIISEIYVTLGPQSEQTCLTIYRTAGSSLFLIMVATEGLLLMRTRALWHDNWKISRFLSTSYLLIAISILTCSVLAMSTDLQSVCAPSSTQSSIEEATRVEHLIMGMFVSSALFEFTVIIVTIYHSIRLRSTERTITTLASNLSWGSMLYALSLFAISVANIISFSLPVSDGQSGIIDEFQGVLHGVMASRVLFDLRDADWRHRKDDNPQSSSYIFRSHMQFISQPIPMTILHDDSNV